jgi:hypothetical protein
LQDHLQHGHTTLGTGYLDIVCLERIHEGRILVGDTGHGCHIVTQGERDHILVLDLDRIDLVGFDIVEEGAVWHLLGTHASPLTE